MKWLFLATCLLYGATALAYFAWLGGLSERVALWGRRGVVAAFLVHTLEVGSRGVAGLHPVSSAREAIGFAAWLLVGAFLVAQLRRRLDAVGALITPTALVLTLAARLGPTVEGETSGLGLLGRLHISLATLGVAVFGLATAVAVLYLIEERQLKHKRMGSIVKKGAALDTLDRLAFLCVKVGFPIFTVAMISGGVWVVRDQVGFRPEYIIAGAAWGTFAGLLLARTLAGWRGRRAALLTITGFAASLVVLGVYLMRAVGA
jgi:ABC-type uncharacterized transport system permease subunit